jgi:hypothetical protein
MSGKELEQRIFLLIDGTLDETLEGWITQRCLMLRRFMELWIVIHIHTQYQQR